MGSTDADKVPVDEVDQAPATPKKKKTPWLLIGLGLLLGALLSAGIMALALNIAQHKAEAKDPFYKVVEITEDTYDPAVWGQNFPLQYEGWKATIEQPETDKIARTPTADDPREFTTPSKLEADPRLVTMWQGYAFAVDYREPRGHAWMLDDQRLTKRVTSPQFKQPGACLNCHASTVPVMKQLGNGDLNAGFAAMNKMTYQDATKLAEHPVACIDCHDPKTMQLRVTRPAFIEGIKEYKEGQGVKDYDVNKMATTTEMRAYVCAQCHVEYYFKGEGKTLTFPWDNGLTVDDALKYYDEVGWSDFTHKQTGAGIVKAQHPDFETWSNGVHAQSGVTCADCHMPYKREGAMKVTDHQIQSPLASSETINRSCLTCHHTSEGEIKKRVGLIQERYEHAKDVSFDALDALIKDLEKAQTDGTPKDRIDAARLYQRKASFFMDYIVSENSDGFHAPAYTMRILNDVTDAARLGQLALKGAAPAPTSTPKATTPAPAPNPTATTPSATPGATASPTR